MKSLHNIVEMARMNKSQIQNGGDELRWQADRMAAKARKLRRAGKEKEAMKALEEAAKLREQAANWKPEEEFEERVLPVYNIGWHRASFFSGIGRNHPYEPGCIREIIEDKFEFLRDGLTTEEKRKWLIEFEDGIVYPKKFEEDDHYGLGIYGYFYINGLLQMFQAVARHKDSEIIYSAWGGKETKVIEVRKDDENLWRVKGEKNWRRMPSRKDWGF